MIPAVDAGKNDPDSNKLSRSFIVQQRLDRHVKYLGKGSNFIICDEACSFFDPVHGITTYDNARKLQVFCQGILRPVPFAAQLPDTLAANIFSAIKIIYFQVSHPLIVLMFRFFLDFSIKFENNSAKDRHPEKID